MNTPHKALAWRVLKGAGILLLSAIMLAVGLDTTPINSREIKAAYHKYLKEPSEQNLKAFQETADRVNRPFHVLQTVFLICGVGLPILYALRLRKQLRAHK